MKIPAKDRIIVAADVKDPKDARALQGRLDGKVGAFKIGLEYMGAEGVRAALESFGSTRGAPVFADGKLKDISETVKKAGAVFLDGQPWMLNMHLLGSSEAAVTGLSRLVHESSPRNGVRPLLLGVTVLTDVTYRDLAGQGVLPNLTEAEALLPQDERETLTAQRLSGFVRNLAMWGQKRDIDGVIASAQEARAIRKACGPDFLIVTPGIRPSWAAANDQKRITTPAEAVAAGADYLVIGRPITDPPDGMTPEEAVARIVHEIEGVFPEQEPLPSGGF